VIDFLTSCLDTTGASWMPILDNFDHLPFIPLNAPGMPEPGDDFVEHATALATPEIGDPDIAVSEFNSTGLQKAVVLDRLYRAALYSPEFFLPIRVRGKVNYARFILGHRWGAKKATGPILDGNPVNVLVLGKMPGVEEERQCLNMVGKNGNLLLQILAEVGMRKADVDEWYITNLVRHANIDPSKKQIAKSWIRNCQSLVHQELRILKPKFVICLGSEASNWMTGGDVPGGASASHGRVLTKRIPIHLEGEPEQWHEFQYMTCLQPAAALHSPDKRPALKDTVRRFTQLASGEMPPEADEHRDHGVIWTVDELRRVVDQIIAEHYASGLPSQPIAIDCEWHGDFWSSCNRDLKGELADKLRHVPQEKGEKESWLRTIQFSHKPGFARTIVLRYGGRRSQDGDDLIGMSAFIPNIEAAIKEFKRLVTPTEGRKVRIVGHLLKADLPWLVQLDKELGELLVQLYNPPEDDPNPDGLTRKFGWQKCRYEGGFDSLYAIHAYQETAERKLEIATMAICGIRRWDGEVQKEKKQICDSLKIGAKKLGGYGEISDAALHKYGNYDVDGTISLFTELSKPGGLLDRDQYGNASWIPFWISQSKLTAELEMEMNGLLIDHKRAEKLTAVYAAAYSRLLKELQHLVRWEEKLDENGDILQDGFNPRSTQQTRCVLFGPQLSGKLDKLTGLNLDPRPLDVRDSVVLNLMPVKTTGKPSKGWDKVLARDQQDEFSPSTDKETLGILLARSIAANDDEARDIIRTLRWYRFINRVTTGVLCPPGDAGQCYFDEDGDMVYEKGVMAAVEWDMRVRTHFLPVDTGRVSSTSINVQNFSKRREADLQLILDTEYTYPLRSIVTVEDGWILDESDFTGAELLMMAIEARAEKMIDHCQRGSLPESDPRHYDIHSRIAKVAFRFDEPPLKSALKKAKKLHLRDIAKTIVFGKPYGRGDEAVIRAVEETGIKVTQADVDKINVAIFNEYPELEAYFEGRRNRVSKPGWMRSWAGRMRRFQQADESALEDLKRVAGNFGIQGGIADCTSTAIKLMYHYPGRRDEKGLRYKLLVQIHDAVMCAVRLDSLQWYREQVLPDCMTNNITIYASDDDGIRLPGRPGYHLGYESTLYKHWGCELSRDEGLALGVPEQYLPKPKN
jgi:uracil-DNA glycosylase family 4